MEMFNVQVRNVKWKIEIVKKEGRLVLPKSTLFAFQAIKFFIRMMIYNTGTSPTNPFITPTKVQ